MTHPFLPYSLLICSVIFFPLALFAQDSNQGQKQEQSQAFDLRKAIEQEVLNWPVADQKQAQTLMQTLVEIQSKVAENEFIFLLDSGFYSGLLDYSWGGQKSPLLDDILLKKFQSDIPAKAMSALTLELALGALQDIQLSINPNFSRGVKGASLINRDKEAKIQLLLPLLNHLLTTPAPELSRSLIAPYQFALNRALLNLLAFARINGIQVTEEKIDMTSEQNVQESTDASSSETPSILKEIDALMTPNAMASPLPTSSKDGQWTPK